MLRRVGVVVPELNTGGSSGFCRAEQTWSTEGVPLAIPACFLLQERIF